MQRSFHIFAVLTVSILVFPSCDRPLHTRADEASPSANRRRAPIADELKPLNSLIGDWRGIGQPKRGSRIGAWSEKISCVWDFSTPLPAVTITSDGGLQFQKLVLKWDVKDGKLLLDQNMEGTVRRYTGKMPEEWPAKILLTSAPEQNGTTFRCTIQQLTDIRVTLLLEKRTSPTGSFRRIAEVGYTRAGAKLAVAGGNQRKCVVTGGLGTIPVTYEGKTYYVCCSGCRQAFNESPEAIIAEYKAALKKLKDE